ncbi:MAG: glycerophosphodiester phosphodiesterase [Clostridiaceae bacterium]|nr:glycerophosphodiester phosphodiesterase [Clostridiaceae bacterium]
MAAAVVILIILFAVILYLIKPNKRRAVKFPCVLFAHRGLHGKGIPENSVAAFRNAKEKGYGVELDVRFTKDKKLIVFHDDDLKRMCGDERKVRDADYADLESCRLCGTDERIPLFSDVLKVLDGAPVICEIKAGTDEPAAEICEAVCSEIKNYTGFICIESFNPFILRWLRKNRPDIIRGQLSMNFIKNGEGLGFLQSFLMTNLFVNVFSRPDFIAYRFTDNSFGYSICRGIFKPLLAAWTVKGGQDRRKAETLFDAVIFEEETE